VLTAVTATHSVGGGGGQALTPRNKIITKRQGRGGLELSKLWTMPSLIKDCALNTYFKEISLKISVRTKFIYLIFYLISVLENISFICVRIEWGPHKLERYATYVLGTAKEHKLWEYRSICIHRKYFHLHLAHIVK
jgi:hypothetical protein